MPKIELYPHNQAALNHLEEALKYTRRAAVIQPTGTGKSFVALAFIERRPNNSFLYLAPSTHMAHYPATYPSQIFFLKEDIGYEIVVLYDGEQHLTRLLQPQEDLRYILVLPHINMAQELVLPSAPHLFATVDYNGQETPDVRFFTESEGDTYAAV